MNEFQKDLYGIIIKHFGDPQFLRYNNTSRPNRTKIKDDLDYILVQWALDITRGNQKEAAELLMISRNTVKAKMQHNDIQTRKDEVAAFMKALGIK